MNATLDPSELSEVYFLIDALVSAPDHAEELGNLTKESKRTERVQRAVDLLVQSFKSMQDPSGKLREDWETAILDVVKKRDRAVADALGWALANRPARRRRIAR